MREEELVKKNTHTAGCVCLCPKSQVFVIWTTETEFTDLYFANRLGWQDSPHRGDGRCPFL